MVGVVALLVVGPERLPGLARTAGAWVGRARSFIGNVKADIDRELKAEELKRILEAHQKSNPLEQIIEDTGDSLAQIRKDVEGATAGMKDASQKDD